MKFETPLPNNNIKDMKSNNEINIVEVYEKYKFHWKWLVLGCLFGLSLAYVYLRYSYPRYLVSTTIFIDDDQSGRLTNELSAFEDLGVLSSGRTNSIINEMGILKSTSLMEKVIQNLGINKTYYLEGEMLTSEIYGEDLPFKVNFFIADSVLNNMFIKVKIASLGNSKFVLKNDKNEILQNIVFGKNIQTEFGEINITPSNSLSIGEGENFIVQVTPLKLVASMYNSKINIGSTFENSSLLDLTLEDQVKEKAEDILNQLVFQYNQNEVDYKSMITKNTDNFINDRIEDISVDLIRVDKGVEDFKTENQLSDINVEMGLDLESNSELKRRIINLNSQMKLVDFLYNHVVNNDKDLIPSNLGLNDMGMNQSTSMYNTLLLERNRIIKGSSVLNPTVINIDQQLETLKESITQSLTSLKSSLEYSLSEARKQEYSFGAKKRAVPKQEREFQDITRERQIIESLYLYLLQKREENAISLGIPVPNAKIIDKANGSDFPVFPKPKLIYLMAGLLGLILPVVIISISSILDTKVHSADDVEALVHAPIIGEIPKTKTKNKLVVSETANSGLAESFRLLRTNLNFMLSEVSEGAKTIFVTSTIGGEGKTFITINLAASLGLLNKKVLLIGADIRKPKIFLYLDSKPAKGLTNFLVDKKLSVSEIINYHDKANIDIIYSGATPPNPSELLLNGRIEEVLRYSKEHYDYIIVDTSPLTLVTDTLLLGKFADMFIYVVRAGFLDKRLLKVAQKTYENNRVPNMTMLVNATDFKGKGYGYGYGYGYGEHFDSKPWWKRIFFGN